MLKVKFLSKADTVEGQGVASVYFELKKLIEERSKKLDLVVNDLQDKTADVIHIHTINVKYLKYMKKTDKPTVVFVHFVPKTLKGSIKFPLYLKWFVPIFKSHVKTFYKKADRLVVVNPLFIKDLIEMGIPREKIMFIPNFVDGKIFKPVSKETKLKLRKKYGYKPDEFISICAGQTQTRKGVTDFIDVAQMCPDKKFIWLGGFSFKKFTDGHKEISKAIDNSRDNVVFPGIVSRGELVEYFQMSDLLFFPSYDELMPMTILEAMSCGLPLLLRDIEPYRPIFKDMYCSANDNDEFKAMIDKFASDKEFLEEHIKMAVEGSETYSAKQALKQWEEFYEDVLDEKTIMDEKSKKELKLEKKKLIKRAKIETKEVKKERKLEKKANKAND